MAARETRKESTNCHKIFRGILDCSGAQQEGLDEEVAKDRRSVVFKHPRRFKMFISLVYMLVLIPTLYFHIELKFRADRDLSIENEKGMALDEQQAGTEQEELIRLIGYSLL